MMDKQKSLKHNVVYYTIYQVMVVLLSLVTVPYLSRVLDPSAIGMNSYAATYIQYFCIFASFGFGFYGQRTIASVRDDPHKRQVAFWELFFSRAGFSLISILLFLILYFVGVFGDITFLMSYYVMNIIGVMIDISFLFEGDERFLEVSIFSLLPRVIGTVLTFLLVKNNGDLITYVIIVTTSQLGVYAVMWLLVPKRVGFVKIKELHPWHHALPALKLFIPTVAISVYTMLDKTLIGLLVPGTTTKIIDGVSTVVTNAYLENGFYEEADKIVKISVACVSSIGAVVLPRNSNEIANGHKDQAVENVYNSLRFIAFLCLPMVLGLMGVSSVFIPVFFGANYGRSIGVLLFLAPIIFFSGVSNVLGMQLLIPSKKDKQWTISVFVGALINLVLSLCFIPFMWSYGAALGSMLAEMLIALIMFYMCRADISLKKVLLSAWKYFVSGGVMFGVVFLLAKTALSGSSVGNLIGLILIGILVYFVMLLLLKDDLFIHEIDKLRAKWSWLDRFCSLFSKERMASLFKSQASVLTLFLLFFLSLFVCLSYLLYRNDEHSLVFALSWSSIFVFVLSFLCLLLTVGRLFSSYTILSVSFFVFHFGQFVAYAFNPNNQNLAINLTGYTSIFNFDFFFLGSCIVYSLYAFVLFTSGQMFYFAYQKKRGGSTPLLGDFSYRHEHEDSFRKAFLYLGIALFAISTPFYGYEMFKDLLIVSKEGYIGLYNNPTATTFASNFSVLFFPSIFLVYAFSDRRWLKNISLIIGALVSVVLLIIGGRSIPVGYLLVLFIIIYRALRNRFKKKWQAATLIVLVFACLYLGMGFIAGLSDFRVSTDRSVSNLFKCFINATFLKSPIEANLIELGFTSYSQVWAASLFGNRYFFGMSYIYSLFGLIPSSLDPTGMVARLVSYSLIDEQIQSLTHASFGYGVSLFAESFLNFSYGGVLFLFIVGFYFSAFSSFDYTDKNDRFSVYLKLIMGMTIFNMARRPAISFTKAYLYGFIVVIVLGYVLYRSMNYLKNKGSLAGSFRQ
jgi:O-antigen/teichoic acid export membrane protein